MYRIVLYFLALLVVVFSSGNPALATAKKHHKARVTHRAALKKREVPHAVLAHRGVAAATAAQAASKKAQHVRTLLDEAKTLWDTHQIAQACGRWNSALDLDPENAEARKGLDGAAIENAKAALIAFGNARSFDDLTEALDDDTTDNIGQRLIVSYRYGIQAINGIERLAPDFAMYDDYENFINSWNLRDLVARAETGNYDVSPEGRLSGRKFLKALAQWDSRARDSGIDVTATPPYGVDTVADGIDHYTFTVLTSRDVLIDGTEVGPNVPLRAVFQDGHWRIAAREGFHLIYQLKSNYHRTHRRRN